MNDYAYYGTATHGLLFAEMLASLQRMPRGSIVVLHACCHNPTGVDPTDAQWTEIIDVVRARGLLPFLDMAYQGFADGIEQDGTVVRRFRRDARAAVRIEFIFEVVFAVRRARRRNERGDQRSRRGRTHPVAVEARGTRQLFQSADAWRADGGDGAGFAGVARDVGSGTHDDARAHPAMRRSLVAKLQQYAPKADFQFVLQQRGMFSYSGLTKAQVQRLRDEFSIYALDTGRICVAALNSRNIDAVAKAIATRHRLTRRGF